MTVARTMIESVHIIRPAFSWFEFKWISKPDCMYYVWTDIIKRIYLRLPVMFLPAIDTIKMSPLLGWMTDDVHHELQTDVQCNARLYIQCNARLYIQCNARLYIQCNARLYIQCNARLYIQCNARLIYKVQCQAV